MYNELYRFDIYPKVFPVNRPVEITVKAISGKPALSGEYRICVHNLALGDPTQEFNAFNCFETKAKASDNTLKFTFTPKEENEHYVRIYKEDKRITQLPVYALEDDLACRLPLRGDLHIHTCRSDGNEKPALVCANYRRLGYDFIVITDHDRYYPSLEAIEAYKDVDIALNILPGEEVHLPGTDVHIVNAGGLFSVNGIIDIKENYTETNGDIDKRRFDNSITPPDILTLTQFNKQIDELEATLTEVPANVDKRWYALCLWTFEKIRKADGLGIFAHPYWIKSLFQLSEPFTRYMMETHPFDAFEVLGGENYYHQNGLQTALYYDEYRYGRIHPIVGSTDSHCSLETNRNRDICSTIVFAKENERSSIISAVKDRYSIAVDTISKEYRLVGEYRFQKYAAFLMENYFPLHDKQANYDGEFMLKYINGEATKEETESVAKYAEKFIEKYIKLL